MGEEETASNDI